MKGDKLWTEDEQQIVAKHHTDISKICRLLPHRTRIAIMSKRREMGFRRPAHLWSAADISKLRKMYPAAPKNEICALFTHSTWINIRQVAAYHGMKRKKLPYKPTGIAPLDQVRDKCFELKLTMPDLDAMCRTKNYFSKNQWRGWNKAISYRKLGRAIKALDGEVQIDWKEESTD